MPSNPDADSTELQAAIAEFLQQLDKSLAALPVSERDAIVRETNQHLEERRARDGNAAVWASLRSFGAAEAYAAQFIGDRIDRGEHMQPTSPNSPADGFRNTVAICVTVVAVLAMLAAGAFLFRS